jgi:hypothetical protein
VVLFCFKECGRSKLKQEKKSKTKICMWKGLQARAMYVLVKEEVDFLLLYVFVCFKQE